MIEGLEYQVRIVAENDAGLSEPSLSSETFVAVQQVGAPTDLRVVEILRSSMYLEWRAPANDGGAPVTCYFVEQRRAPTGRWEKCNYDVVSACEYHACELVREDSYEFRVTARNSRGVNGPPSEVCGPVLCKVVPEPPKVHVDVEEIVVEAGEQLAIASSVAGRPRPEISWSREDTADLAENNRAEISTTRTSSTLKLNKMTRDDASTYKVTAVNSKGEHSAVVKVKVLDSPGPPKGPVKFENVTSNSCILKWERPVHDGGSDVKYYTVSKCETSRLSWTLVLAKCTSTHCRVSNLVKGREYIFRVFAVTDIGRGSVLQSEPLVARDSFNLPDRPGKPKTVSVSSSSVILAWEKPPSDGGSPITNYVLQKRDARGSRWVDCNKGRVNDDEQMRVTELRGDAVYEFRVAACNKVGMGDFSENSAKVSVKEPTFVPGSPINFRVSDKSKTSVSLTWEPPLSDGGSAVTGYALEHAVNSTALEWKPSIPTSQIVSTEYVVGGLTPNEVYMFRAFAVNACGRSEEPAETHNPVTAADVESTPLLQLDDSLRKLVNVRAGKPLRLYVLVSGRPQPEIKWSKQPDDRLESRATVDTHEAATCLFIEKCDKFDAGKYTVSATNESGTQQATVKVRVHDTPGPPNSLQAVEVERSFVRLRWNPPEVDGGSEVKNYLVQVRLAQNKAWTTVTTKCLKTSYKVSDLVYGKTYYFQVLGENETGIGEPHALKSAVTVSELPPAPYDFEVDEVTDDSVTLKWKKDSDVFNSKEITYVVEMTENESIQHWRTAAKTKTALSLKIQNLVKNGEYRFRVYAKNYHGKSEVVTYASDVRVRAPEVAASISESDLPEDSRITLRAGRPLKISVPVKGSPFPSVEWFKDDKKIFEDRLRTKMRVEDGCKATLEVRETTSDDEAVYSIVATNAAGSCKQNITVKILDVPGVPEGPIRITAMKGNTLTLNWNAPIRNGGANITNYVVEKRDRELFSWKNLSASVTGTLFRVEPLFKGKHYDFRVSAQNRYGVGMPLYLEKTLQFLEEDELAPSAPRSVEVGLVTKSSVSVSWSIENEVEVDGYFVEHRQKKSARWVRSNQLPTKQNRLTCPELAEGCEYEFRVVAVNEHGESQPSAATKFVLVRQTMTPPDAPTNLRYLDFYKGILSVTWDRPEYEGQSQLLGYNLELFDCSEPPGRWVRCNQVPIRINEFQIRGTKVGDKIAMRVSAFNKNAESEFKQSEEFIEVVDLYNPPEILLEEKDMEITVHSKAALIITVPYKGRPTPLVEWTKTKGEEVDLKISSLQAVTQESAELVIKDCDRKDAGSYRCMIKNKYGMAKATVNVTVIGRPERVSGPVQFRDVNKTGVTVQWKAPVDNGGSEVVSYVVERREVGRPGWITVDEKVEATRLEVKGLTEGKEYFFRVAAENAFGVGDALVSEESVKPETVLKVPNAPHQVDIDEVGRDWVSISWIRVRSKNVFTPVVSGYYVERKEENATKWVRCNQVRLKRTTFTVQGLVEHAEYRFRVFAENEVGIGKPSNPTVVVRCKEPNDRLPAPKDFEVVSTTKDSVILAWNKPVVEDLNVGRVQGYVLERRETSMTVWRQCHEEDMLFESCHQVQNLNSGSEYEFRVFAVNRSGRSPAAKLEDTVVVKSAGDEKPRLEEEIQQAVVMRGKSASLIASVVGQPTPEVIWMRNGREVKRNSRCKVNWDGRIASIQISEIMDHEGGTYALYASNKLGYLETEAKIIVAGVPILNDRDGKYKSDVTCRQGQNMRLYVPFYGYPKPAAEWTLNGKVFEANENCSIETTSEFTMMRVKSATRSEHSGTFEVKLTNKHGASSVPLRTDVHSVPGAPTGVTVDCVTFDSVFISWQAPADNGGVPVSCYIIEKKDAVKRPTDKWDLVTAFTSKLNWRVRDLVAGKSYYFRVSAQTCYGTSEAAMTQAPVVAGEILDVPKPPSKPIPTGVTKDGCMLSWRQPKSDGGSPVTHYVIERRDSKRKYWMTINDEEEPDEKEYSVFYVTGLVEGFSYQFRVRAANAHGQSEPSEVSATVEPKEDITVLAPKFVQDLDNVVTKVGEKAVLSCKITGNPKPVIKWYKLGAEIIGSHSVQMHEGKANNYSLVLSKVKKQDQGSYTVRATNHGGSVSMAAKLRVERAPEVQISEEARSRPFECRVNEVVSIKVPYSCEPTPAIKWKRESSDEEISQDERMQVHDTDSFTTLTLTNARRDDTGNYVIDFTNKYGTESATVSLVVSDVPERPHDVIATDVDSDSVTLKWQEPEDDGGKPITSYIVERSSSGGKLWTRDGTSTKPEYTVYGTASRSEYRFRVIAKNSRGESRHSEPTNTVMTKDDKMLGCQYDRLVDVTSQYSASKVEKSEDSLREKYQLFEVLGQSDECKVYRAKEVSTGKTFAAKVFANSKESSLKAEKEIAMMQKLQSSGFLQLHEWFESDQETALVYEFVSGGNILEGIFMTQLSEDLCRKLVKQICKSVQELHSKDIAHFDICPENIIFKTQDDENNDVKLVGLENSKEIKNNESKFCFLYKTTEQIAMKQV